MNVIQKLSSEIFSRIIQISSSFSSKYDCVLRSGFSAKHIYLAAKTRERVKLQAPLGPVWPRSKTLGITVLVCWLQDIRTNVKKKKKNIKSQELKNNFLSLKFKDHLTISEIYNLFVNIWVNVCKIQEDSENKTLNHLGMLLNGNEKEDFVITRPRLCNYQASIRF